MVKEQGIDYINKYFPEMDQRKKDQFEMLASLYAYWNEKINLISRKDIENLYLHHVLHSLSLCKFVKLKDQSSLLDVGTGGGLPGIPLAIMYPDISFLMIDGRGKKIKAVKEIITALQLENAEAQAIRSEDLNSRFDIITGRAVTSLDRFLLQTSKNRKDNAEVYYWTGEREGVKGWSCRVFSIEDFLEEAFFKGKYIVRACRRNKV